MGQAHRIAASLLLALTCLISSSQDKRYLQPVLVAFWVMAISSRGDSFVKIPVKWILLNLNICIAGVMLYGTLFHLPVWTRIFSSSVSALPRGISSLVLHDATTSSSRPWAWIMRVMWMFLDMIPTLLSGTIVGMAYRFDYAQSQAPVRLPTHVEAASTKIKSMILTNTVEGFSKPTFWSAIASLAFSLALGELGSIYLGDERHLAGGLYTALTVPCVSGATLFVAWYGGKLDAWKAYTETWGAAAESESMESLCDAYPVDSEKRAVSEDEEKPTLLVEV
ncbi:hypothetical protein BD324DRAFT_636348 [Kockovaella imperatae]|uniref:Uncharacterized protein n=1 Tax=Kockovaella imperatae TaxID=4999 RepID=A0A1Y1U936_9TREE|nr:hypothetical protein BD324DRAFT_636348 [Kockovaella imperatae]ORX34549.1 hypothetical protein BD324DRAFT_636348 [Kockovaella imperatae]